MQQGDVLLYQTPDDGELNVVSGVFEMTAGLDTAAYLSLFGGNEDDDGMAENRRQWWGNVTEPDAAKHYRSETQNLLQAIEPIPANLRRIEGAVLRDLAWLDAEKITVNATMPRLNTLQLDIMITAGGKRTAFTFVENWKASA